jgi:class 3 adenylate cyclase
MSIRWKLFLALFVLTAAVVGGVLWLVEARFRSWTLGMVNQAFARRVDSVLEARGKRSDALKEMCDRIAADPITLAMLQSQADEQRRAEFLRKFQQLRAGSSQAPRSGPRPGNTPRSRIGPGARLAPKAGAQGAGKMISKGPTTLGLVRPDGEFLLLAGGVRRTERRSPKQIRESLSALDSAEQRVAYLVVEPEQGGQAHVHEVVVTPVSDGGELAGWVFLGSPAGNMRGEERILAMGQMEARGGLVAGGRWFVDEIDEAAAALLAGQLAEGFWTSGEHAEVSFGDQQWIAMARPLNERSPMDQGYYLGLFPLTPVLAELSRIRWMILLLGALALLVSAIVAWTLARKFSKPIHELVEGTARVARGDFAAKIQRSSRDEFGHLAEAFNRMTDDLALKERYHEVLGKVSDPDVTGELLSGKLELGGELRRLAVLFCDIRGFTSITRGMAPFDVVELVNGHMTAMTRLVYEHGGVVDKFVGDEVMALFGAPKSYGDDELNALRCGLAMQRERERLNREVEHPLQIGVGIATGEMVAGCMGSNDRLNYTVLGERVNLASRLCSKAGPGEVLIATERTLPQMDDSTVESRRLEVDGYAEQQSAQAFRPS